MELKEIVLLLVASLGFISASKLLLKTIKWTWIMFFRPSKDLKQYGSWALITGSTDGIGKALAFELASKGLNLILTGRNPKKLKSTSMEIAEKAGGRITIKTVVLDFSTCHGEDIVKILERETRELDTGILINNAGLAYPYARFFHEVDTEMMEQVIKVNVEATTWVTKAVLPSMLSRKKGAIVNIGSGSAGAVSSYPLYTIYAATKGYVSMLSKCISLEYKQQGIDIQCQIPFVVATKLASVRNYSFFIPSPEKYSKASIRFIGYDEICMPYWPHTLQAWLLSLLPEALQDWCIFQYLLGMRARGLMKDQNKRNQK